MLRSSGPLTEIKLMPDSFAIAWTTRKIRTVKDGKSKDYIFRHQFKIISHNWWFVFFLQSLSWKLMPVCLSACLSKPVGLYACVSDCLICLSICVRLSVYLFMSVCTSVSVYLSVILTVSETDEGTEIVADKAKKGGGRRNTKLRSQRRIQRNDTAWLSYLNYCGLIISSSFCVPLLEEFYHSLVVQPVESPGVEWDRALGILLDISLEPDRMGSQ